MGKIFLLLAVLMLSACSQAADGAEDVVADTQLAEGDSAEMAVDLTGRTFVLSLLEAEYPTTELNGVWAKMADEYALILLFRVVEHDMVNGKITVSFAPGSSEAEEQEDGTFKLLAVYPATDPKTFTATMDGMKFTIDGEVEIDIHDPTVNKPFHLVGITGYGVFNADGSKVVKGHLQGGILEATAMDMCCTLLGLGVVNFHWFMNLVHMCPTADTDNDQVVDSYFFEGNWAATDRSDVYKSEVRPIVPNDNVKNCEAHTEVCIPKK